MIIITNHVVYKLPGKNKYNVIVLPECKLMFLRTFVLFHQLYKHLTAED